MKFIIVVVFVLASFCFISARQTEGYIPIQWDANNQTLVDILHFGVHDGVSEAVLKHQIPDADWGYTDVRSVEVQEIKVGTFFDFTVDLGDDFGHTAGLNVIVFALIPDYSEMTFVSSSIIQASG